MEWIELDKLIKFQTKSKIKAGEGKSEGKYLMYTSSMIVDKYLDEFQYNEEALIMGTGGSASIHYSTGNFGTSTDCYVLYNKGKNIMLKYIYLYLLGNINILEEGFRGAGLKHTNQKYIKSIKIPVPSLKIQEKIVKVLDQAQALIDKRKEQIKALDQLIESIFYTMFGDPVRNEKGWESGTIRDLTAYTQYGTSKKAYEKGNYPILRMGNITYEGNWNLNDLKYIDLDKKEKEKFLVKKGDLLFNRTNSRELVGKTAVYKEDYPMAFAGYLIKLEPNEKGNTEYISSYLNSRYGKLTLLNLAKSIVGMANINAQELQDIKILLPPISLQNEFEHKVETIEKQKELLNQSLELLEENYKSIMDKAFKGQLFN